MGYGEKSKEDGRKKKETTLSRVSREKPARTKGEHAKDKRTKEMNGFSKYF